MNQIVVNEPNRWRLDTPGATGWPRSARPDAAKKYFMVSADGHANEPANLWVERIDAQVPRAPAAGHHRQGRRAVARERRPSARPAAAVDPRRRGPGAQQGGRRSARPARRPRSRRHRCRADLPQQGPRHVGDARSAVRHGAVPGLERLGVGAVRHPPGPHDPGRRARHRRPRRLDRRGAAAGQARLQVPDAAVQADLGRARQRPRELQPAALRSAVGGDQGRQPADHLPRLDRPRSARRARQRRRGRELRLAFAVADHRAGGQPLRLGRARALPDAALRHHRGRHRLGAVAARRDGRGLQEASLLGAAQAASTCRASTTACTASPPSRRTRPGSISPRATASPATSCGPTTIRTTRAPGRIRRRRSSAPWASSPTARAPRSSA